LVCTHATFRLAVEKPKVEAFDDRLVAVNRLTAGGFEGLAVNHTSRDES